MGSRDPLPAVCWLAAAVLLSFLGFAHLGVLTGFALGLGTGPWVAALATIGSAAAGLWLARREDLARRTLFYPIGIAAGVVALALLVAGSFYDLSWDGLWYHQTAVFQMDEGWNPLAEPMRGFTEHLEPWLRYYAKGPWYVALAFYEATGDIEVAKAMPTIALAAMFFAVWAAGLDLGLSRFEAGALSALVSANPVMWFELVSYLVDGLMVAFLACFVAATVRWLARPSFLTGYIGFASVVLAVNTKLSGPVYLGFLLAGVGLFVLWKLRGRFLPWVALQLGALVAAIGVFGYNPYVTNTVHRGNPFYPILGSKAYPSLRQQGEDPIERWETPKNLLDSNRFVRLGYAIFGRPGAPPYYPGEDAELMWPGDVRWQDFAMYYFHDVRISGFGPLFSVAFLMALVLISAALTRPRLPRSVLLLTTTTILVSLLISPHTWWARYGPHLWWLPIVGVIAGYASPGWTRRLARALAVLLLVNVVLIVWVHLAWELEATRKTERQLAELRQAGEIEVDLQFFSEPFGRRLRRAGVAFSETSLHCREPVELMSVSEGYPMAAHACLPAGTGPAPGH